MSFAPTTQHSPMGKITAASNMITTDHLKKTLGRTHNGKPFYQYNNPMLPKNLDSPFGNFSPGNRGSKRELVFGSPYKSSSRKTSPVGSPLKQKENMMVNANRTLTKGMGVGGKSNSLRQPKLKLVPTAPMAGAQKTRWSMPSEFRRFYDRGDMPIAV